MASTHPRPADSFVVTPGIRPAYTTDSKHPGETRPSNLKWLPNRVRHILVSMLGEFVGTFLFLFFAFAGTQVANTPPGKSCSPPNIAVLLYISLAFGFSLAVNVWVFFRISGGLFNPAVSILLALVGAIGWLKAALLIISQLAAGIAAAATVSGLFPGPLTVRTGLNCNTSVVRGLFIEMFLTAMLCFTILMLAGEKHRATFLAPIGIGLALFIAELAGVFYTGGSLNPARSFGPDVVLHTFDHYHWIYWIGPILGALLAWLFYRLIKMLEYETANPGADHDGRAVRYVESPELLHDNRNPPMTHNPPVTHTETTSRYMTAIDPDTTRHTTGHRMDGTDDSFAPAYHPINKPYAQAHALGATAPDTTKHTTVATGHRTDGTDDSFAPAYHPINKPYAQAHALGATAHKPTPQGTGVSSRVSRPLPIYQHGGDGHRSTRSFVDHPNERPRAHHTQTSRSSRSQHTETYHSGPSLESASSSTGTSATGSSVSSEH